MNKIEQIQAEARERHNVPVLPGRNKGKRYHTKKREEMIKFQEKVFRIKRIAERFNKTA